MALPEHLRTGLRGEQLAARALVKRGDTILASGFRTALGETDIISISRDLVLCFVEVKTRAPDTRLPPSEAVDREKQERLINNAAAFIKHLDVKYRAVRFDIAEVLLYDLFTADVNIIENAFGQEALPGKTDRNN